MVTGSWVCINPYIFIAAILIGMRPSALRQVPSGGLLPRLLAHNAHKRMSAMLKPITNYGFPHSLTTCAKTAFPAASQVVTTVQASLLNSLSLYKNMMY